MRRQLYLYKVIDFNHLERNTFTKAERLCSRKIMDELFASGKSFTQYPFRLIWVETELPENIPAQIAFSVPKRHYKKAVERNLIKRRMREAYRKNKFFTYNYLNSVKKQCAFILIFTGKQIADYTEIENKLILTFKQFANKHNEPPVEQNIPGDN